MIPPPHDPKLSWAGGAGGEKKDCWLEGAEVGVGYAVENKDMISDFAV